MPAEVLHVASSAPRFAGDWTSPFVLDEARVLHAQGWASRIVCPAPGRGARARETLHGIPIERVAYLPRGLRPRLAYGEGGAAGALSSAGARLEALPLLLALARGASRASAAHSTAAIVAHWPETGAAVWPAARRRGIPWALRVHRVNPRGLAEGLVFRALVGAASMVLANSEYTRKRVEEWRTPRRLRVVPPMIAPELLQAPERPAPPSAKERFGLPPDRPIVLALGRLVEKKGHRHLLNAAAELRSPAGPPLVVIAGDGPQRASLEAHGAVVSGRARLLQSVTRPLIPHLLRAAAVVVQPSIVDRRGEAETYGVSVMEALLAGRPVIVARSGALAERIHEGARVVPPGDVRALAWAINALLGDPRRAEAAGRESAGLARAHCHQGRERLCSAIEELVASARGPARDG